MCNSTKTCKFCNQPVTPDMQQSMMSDTVYALYTCKNRDCRAGRLDITLCADGFDALDEATLQSYERGATRKVAS